ncbi:TOM1 [Candida theae]|uniref:HECT-type E3 ubiquitin transferase n=1 Tax=Candida theae TaxID=1198502 RepID=A0AAD5BDN4_9ASCO|nr:TOM1 [Candida theae]KAI5957642.1 TOM1 [Candida theae]
MELAAPIKSLIDGLIHANEEEFIVLLKSNLQWKRPRGDLLPWIPVLNRIDEIFARYIKEYDLENEFPKLRVIPEDDAHVILTCLEFTNTLLSNCSDKHIYSSMERIYALINTPTIDVRLKALEVAVLLSEKFVSTGASRYSAPKEARDKILEIAKAYPPLVPADCYSRKVDNEQKELNEKSSIIGDHYNFVDTLSHSKVLPQKWKSINFQYYKSAMSQVKPSEESGTNSSKGKSDKLVVSEGLQIFCVPEESVAKLTLEQIFSRGMESLPKNSWFTFGLVSEVAKSFNSQADGAFTIREKLIQMKCFAAAFTCCMLSHQSASTKLLEAEPYILSFLVDAISPENSVNVPRAVFYAAMKALECVSMKKVWGSDILRCMGGNVSHGVLFQCLRRIKTSVAQDDDEYFEEGSISFFNMLGNMINTKSILPRLASGGLLNDLMPFLDIRSKYKWTCSAAIHSLSLLIAGLPDTLDEFIANDGFNSLIGDIQFEVDSALNQQGNEESLYGECPQYTKVPLRKANFLRNLMKFVADLLNSDQGDRLRNLFDSPILSSFNKIVNNPDIFGPAVLACTIDSVFFIIHNEPTAFSILNEANVIDTILDNYRELFVPSGQLLMSLPEVLGAICLNNEGLKKVIDKKSIPIFFDSFYRLPIAKVLVKSDMATNLGCSFDELGRHYSSLKPLILKQVSNLIEQIMVYVDKQMDGIQLYESSSGPFYNSKDEDSNVNVEGGTEIETWDKNECSILLDNVFFFLGGLLQESGSWGEDVARDIGFSKWLRFLTIKKAPYDYFLSNGISSLMGIFKYFDDEDRDYGFPMIVEKLRKMLEIEVVDRYLFSTDEGSFFDKLNDTEGTELLQYLGEINVLLFALTEIYVNLGLLFTERIKQIIDMFGSHHNFVMRLFLLLQRSVLEETILRNRTPNEVLKMTSNFPNDSPPLQINVCDPADSKINTSGTNPKFKNTLQLRTLNYYFQGYIALIFASIVRTCIPRRVDHAHHQTKRDAVSLLLCIANLMTDSYKRPMESKYNKQCYILALSNINLYILFQKERAKETAYTPLGIALFQSSFYAVLREVTRDLWQDLLQMDPEEVKKTANLKYICADESSIVKNAISQSLMIFAKSVNEGDLGNFPFYKSYFSDKPFGPLERGITMSFLAQVSYEALKLVFELVESVTNSTDGHATKQNVPTPLIEQVIYIASHSHQENECTDNFIPLDVRRVFPDSDQVAYLISLGMSESQAEHYFDHESDLTALSEGRAISCQEFDNIKNSDWKAFSDEYKSAELDFSLDGGNYPNSRQIFDECNKIWESLDGKWISLAITYPKATRLVADLLVASKDDQRVDNLINEVTSTRDMSDEEYVVYLHLISLLVEKVESAKSDTLLTVGKLFTKFSMGPSTVDKPFYQYLMAILEQRLVDEDIPLAEPTDHEGIKHKSSESTNDLSVRWKDRFLDEVSKVDQISDLRSANGLSRVLALLAKDYAVANKIAKMPLLGALLKLAGTPGEDKSVMESFSTCIVLIMRYSFETRETVESYMKPELLKILGSSFKSTKNLRVLLKDSMPLVFRNPRALTDTISGNIILEGYSGQGSHLAYGDLVVTKADDTKQSEESDIEGYTDPRTLERGTVMSHLLSELMNVFKSDWVSDPKDEGNKTEKEKAKLGDAFANTNFAYMCFLLQTIAELLGSYKQAKLDFLTFTKRKHGDVKPRSTSLNFFLHQLIPTQSLTASGSELRRRVGVSETAKMALMCLISSPVSDSRRGAPNPKKEDPDLALIRRFVVDLMVKVMKETSQLNVVARTRYGKLLDLFELSGQLISTKFRDTIGPLLDKESISSDVYHMSKVYIEKQVPATLTTLIAEFDLNFPDIDKVEKAALKPITNLGKNKVEFQELFAEDGQDENDDDDIVPDDENEDRDDTPDLFRNSTLGMYDVDVDSEEDDYYDEDGRLMISAEASDSMDSASSFESDEGEPSDVDMDEGSFGNEEDSEGSLDDIEIIDELDIDSSSDEGYGYGDGEDEDEDEEGDEVVDVDVDIEGGESVSGEEYSDDDDDDDDESEYDEEELDGWIEELGSENESEQEGWPNGDGRHRHGRLHEDGNVNFGFGEYNADGDATPDRSFRFRREDEFTENSSDEDNESESQPDVAVIPSTTALRRVFDQAGNGRMDGTSPISLLLDGLFREGNLRGSIEITQDGVHRTGASTIGRLFENMIHIGQAGRNMEHTHTLHLKSTVERWADALKMFDPKDKEDLILRVIPGIVNRIEAKSIEAYRKKKEQSEKLRKEREEKRKKQLEEEQRKQEEERKQREENAANEPPREPILVRIGDRDVDISGTDIDPDYIEALPEDMREEVFASYVRERRANASTTNSDAREIDPDFLDALPGNIRDEILQSESLARRFSEWDENRDEFEDAAADHDDDDDDDGEEEEEGEEGAEHSRPQSSSNPSTQTTGRKKSGKIFFTPLVDKNGIAAIIRLLFSPLSINQREQIYHALQYMCNNKHSRAEIINMMVAVLHEAFTNQRSMQKIYSQICSRALGGKEVKSRIPLNTTPISTGIQFVESIDFLLERNSHLRYFILTDHDNQYMLPLKKSKKVIKESKYPINYLLKLLDNKLVAEDQTFLDVLARVLQLSTRPLYALKKLEGKSAPFSPPIIPEENIRSIITILTGNDCSNSTFRRTISAMQNLSVLQNVSDIFKSELSKKATEYGHKIITDLNKLTSELAVDADSNSKAFSKFSAHSSDQAKLLRVLTALDYMFEHKDKDQVERKSDVEELTELYKKLALGNLWDSLSECLRVLEKNPQLHNIANALLPLIEALMVVCKHGKVRDLQNKENVKYEVKKIDFTKEPIESLFFSFTDEHKKILNQMVRTNPNLMSGPFGMLVKNPKVLEFDNKKNYFDRKLHKDKPENSKLAISIRRDQVFLDSYRALFFKPKDEFKNSKLEINFKGEQGIDAGGVTREWYQVLSRQMFNPDYALFLPVVSDKTTFHPNRTSYVNPEHLSFFKFIGRIIGKAIYDNCFLDCHFSRAVYKRILGEPQSLKDMETLDLEYYKSLIWMLENDITDVITETLSVETDDYGEHKVIDLIPNGSNIPVTEENKQLYVKKVVEYRLQTSVEEQMENFLIGFHEIIPQDLVSIFDEKELELLISGLPDIDVHDWQSHTQYVNYSASSVQIQWFWRAVKSFDNEERARLLQFATGTSKVPLNGFKELTGASGTCKFSIHRDYGATDRLPSSHTCFNQIDLPAYENYETLRGSLLMAITEGHEGFGLA